VFAEGNYRPVVVSGQRAAHVLAFMREAGGERLLVAVGLRLSGMDGDWWGDTAIDLDGAATPVARLLGERTVIARII
jgi:(1->4)-alpha-D-glucan 1-alpha-D-glucosylmutase